MNNVVVVDVFDNNIIIKGDTELFIKMKEITKENAKILKDIKKIDLNISIVKRDGDNVDVKFNDLVIVSEMDNIDDFVLIKSN